MADHGNAACTGRLLLGTALLVFLVLLWPADLNAGAGGNTIRVGVYENAPKISLSASGQPQGIFIDLIEHIAQQEGWKLQYVPGTWAQCLDWLEKGDLDIMPDVAPTPDREKIFSFHKTPVLSSWLQIYSPRGSRIKSILDLNGKKILVLERSVQQESFNRLSKGFGLDFYLVAVPDYATMFAKLAKGEADAAITNRFYGQAHAKKLGLMDTAIIFEPSDLYFATPKSDPKHLLPFIDRHIAQMKKDPRSAYFVTLKKWISEDFPSKLPPWLPAAGLAAGFILALSLAGSLVLKHQVNSRTRELRQINQEMEGRISQRTAELAMAMEKAQAADRIKSAFLATMSHELRTPLNSIIGFTGILLQGLAGSLNQEQQKQMSMVQGSARHLLALINDVLDISKIEAGQLELFVSSFDLRSSIEKTAALVLPQAQKKGISLQTSISDDVQTITADQRRLEQVMLNLLNNAVKFTEKGNVRLSCFSENSHVVLSVADTGIGMKPEELPDLFKPFHQIDTGLARRHEGSGLGLSICKRLMDLMDGTIQVESRWGQGSTFTIHFPAQAGAMS